MNQGTPVQSVPSYTEVERAIRSVPGVAEASVSRASDTGRGRLRIRLQPGEDPDRVSWSVAATLRERFGIALDPDEIRPKGASDDPEPDGAADGTHRPRARPAAADEQDRVLSGMGVTGPDESEPEAPTVLVVDGDGDDDGVRVSGRRPPPARPGPARSGPAAPAATGAATGAGDAPAGTSGPVPDDPSGVARAGRMRPAIRDLTSRNDGTSVTVTATLDLAGRAGQGEARSAPTTRGLRRAIAEATVLALGQLVEGPLRAQVDRIVVGDSDPAAVSVVISMLQERGEELLVGGSIIRDDIEHAVMRATLDALNRRVQPGSHD